MDLWTHSESAIIPVSVLILNCLAIRPSSTPKHILSWGRALYHHLALNLNIYDTGILPGACRVLWSVFLAAE